MTWVVEVWSSGDLIKKEKFSKREDAEAFMDQIRNTAAHVDCFIFEDLGTALVVQCDEERFDIMMYEVVIR